MLLKRGGATRDVVRSHGSRYLLPFFSLYFCYYSACARLVTRDARLRKAKVQPVYFFFALFFLDSVTRVCPHLISTVACKRHSSRRLSLGLRRLTSRATSCATSSFSFNNFYSNFHFQLLSIEIMKKPLNKEANSRPKYFHNIWHSDLQKCLKAEYC